MSFKNKYGFVLQNRRRFLNIRFFKERGFGFKNLLAISVVVCRTVNNGGIAFYYRNIHGATSHVLGTDIPGLEGFCDFLEIHRLSKKQGF